MKARPFSIGQRVFGVRDLELTNKGIVLGYEESERAFVLVSFDGATPIALPVQSLQDRPDQSRLRPDISWRTEYSQAANLGDYLRRMGEAESDIFTKEKERNEKTR